MERDDQQGFDPIEAVKAIMNPSDPASALLDGPEAHRFRNKARAQGNLLETLASERKNVVPKVKSVGKSIDMSSIPRPLTVAETIQQEVTKEAGEVAICKEDLPFGKERLEGPVKSAAIGRVQRRRKVRHDASIAKFRKEIIVVSEELEKTLIDRSRELRDDVLKKKDEEIAEELDTLREDGVLRGLDHGEVLQCWSKTATIARARQMPLRDTSIFWITLRRGGRRGARQRCRQRRI